MQVDSAAVICAITGITGMRRVHAATHTWAHLFPRTSRRSVVSSSVGGGATSFFAPKIRRMVPRVTTALRRRCANVRSPAQRHGSDSERTLRHGAPDGSQALRAKQTRFKARSSNASDAAGAADGRDAPKLAS
eukprot:364246-Chlamydomonas_euryale.AAC.9